MVNMDYSLENTSFGQMEIRTENFRVPLNIANRQLSPCENEAGSQLYDSRFLGALNFIMVSRSLLTMLYGIFRNILAFTWTLWHNYFGFGREYFSTTDSPFILCQKYEGIRLNLWTDSVWKKFHAIYHFEHFPDLSLHFPLVLYSPLLDLSFRSRHLYIPA